MLKDLVANAAIVMSFLLLAGEIFRDNRLKPIADLRIKTIAGLLAGFFGIVLMFYSVTITRDVLIDLRQFALIAVAIHAGMYSAVIAGFIMSLFRMFFFGINETSVYGAILIMLIAMICGIIAETRLYEHIKWLLMIISSVFIFSIFILITVGEEDLQFRALLHLWIISAVVGYLVKKLLQHIVLSNNLYHKYKTESTVDYLTGLGNVRTFDEQLNDLMERAKTGQEHFSLLALDIDHFKSINDVHGHTTGDEVLRELAKILKAAAHNTDCVFRVGGDEFGILLPGFSSKEAFDYAEHIREAVSKHRFWLRKLKVTLSIGSATIGENGIIPENILEEADNALYYAKRSGRNKVHCQ